MELIQINDITITDPFVSAFCKKHFRSGEFIDKKMLYYVMNLPFAQKDALKISIQRDKLSDDGEDTVSNYCIIIDEINEPMLSIERVETSKRDIPNFCATYVYVVSYNSKIKDYFVTTNFDEALKKLFQFSENQRARTRKF